MIFKSVQLVAQSVAENFQQPIVNRLELMGQHLIAAIVFSIVGVIIFFGSLLLMEKLTPFSIIKEIGEEHNNAVALIVGAIVVGIALIIAAAILG